MTYNVQNMTSTIAREIGSAVVVQNWLNCSKEDKRFQRFSVNLLLAYYLITNSNLKIRLFRIVYKRKTVMDLCREFNIEKMYTYIGSQD